MKGFVILVAAAASNIVLATETYRHGNSTATITQDGEWSEFWIERDFDSQTIIRRSRDNSAVIRQSRRRRRRYTAPPPDTRSRCMELDVSEEFRRLFLDRFNQKYCK
jgi:hypothetical protein